ncbi:predicted protein [Nematostella vectensis]|uniref:Replication factor Mcm10 C-terminal domain-containing protein n=1 Tax=Nematostella vectensis TaxID=45351 RepID=A7SU53_NEMVE|nr:predicted protein [Nematostella vectensis]|eukprot:XP_001624864.1 predicted protein [Nematostella vectensis]
MTEHCKQKTSEPMKASAFFGEKTRVARSSTPLQQSGTKASAKSKAEPKKAKLIQPKAQNYLPKQQRQLPEHDDKDVTKERFSGLRIINPLISSTVMAQRMEGRKIVPISQIESKLSKGKEKDIDWVTIGALASKLPPRTSSNVLATTGYGAPNKGALMNKLQKNMSSSSFMYQGKTLTLGAPAPQKSKNVSLKSLGIAGDSEQDTSIKKTKTAKPKQSEAASDFLRDLLALPTPGTRNLIKHLHKDEEERVYRGEKTLFCVTFITKLYTLRITYACFREIPMEVNSALLLFQLRALSVVKQKGPIEKEDPNAVRKKRSPSAIQTVGKRVDKDQSASYAFCQCEVIIGTHQAQAERQEQYFSSLEKKEQLEDKLKSIKEIIVKVYCCKKCDYVAESASDICFKENHPLKQTKAPKRFFSCKNCKQRTISYGARMPKLTCKNCGEMNYERTSMFMEKQGPKIAGETLLVRGEEHSKFMNSFR